MLDNPATPPRFPYIAALLCAMCVGAAAWTWMRYSYAWEVTPADLHRAFTEYSCEDWHDYYVRVNGEGLLFGEGYGADLAPARGDSGHMNVQKLEGNSALFIFPPSNVGVGGPPANGFRGRVLVPLRVHRKDIYPEPAVICWTASRFHGASIAGLVVGVMGVFVFTVALRHWLGERRKFREGTRA